MFTYKFVQDTRHISLDGDWKDMPAALELNGFSIFLAGVEDVPNINRGSARVEYDPLSDRMIVSGCIAGQFRLLLKNLGFRAYQDSGSFSAPYTLELASVFEEGLKYGNIPCSLPTASGSTTAWLALRSTENMLAAIRAELGDMTEGPKVPYLLRLLEHYNARLKIIKDRCANALAVYNSLRRGHRITTIAGKSGKIMRVNEQSVALSLDDGTKASVPFAKLNMDSYAHAN